MLMRIALKRKLPVGVEAEARVRQELEGAQSCEISCEAYFEREANRPVAGATSISANSKPAAPAGF